MCTLGPCVWTPPFIGPSLVLHILGPCIWTLPFIGPSLVLHILGPCIWTLPFIGPSIVLYILGPCVWTLPYTSAVNTVPPLSWIVHLQTRTVQSKLRAGIEWPCVCSHSYLECCVHSKTTRNWTVEQKQTTLSVLSTALSFYSRRTQSMKLSIDQNRCPSISIDNN